MPPGALSRYLQFPKVEEEQEENPQSPANPTAPIKKVQPGAMPGVQTVNVTAPRYGGIDDDIQQQMDTLKALQASRPGLSLGTPPQMPQLPQRPQASAWEAIPQLLAGAGDVLGTAGGSYRNYLGQVQGQLQGKRDQAYSDQIAQAHNMFQNAREQYSDTLMRHAMEQREQQEKFHQAKSMLETLVEQKYLQGQKTPQDMYDQQKAEAYRQMFDKFDMLKDVDETERQLKATRPPGEHQYIMQAASGKRNEIGGRPQGIIEQMMGTKPGRGFFEPPEGWPKGIPAETPQDREFKKTAEGGAEKQSTLEAFKKVLSDPDKYYPQSQAKRQGLTKEQYIQKLQEGMKKVESGPENKKAEEQKKSSLGEKLKAESEKKSGSWWDNFDPKTFQK